MRFQLIFGVVSMHGCLLILSTLMVASVCAAMGYTKPKHTDMSSLDPLLRENIASSAAKSVNRKLERSRSWSAREMCRKCRRPSTVCLCSGLPNERISTATQILILQHPKEFRRRKTISTVPLIPLVLRNVSICVDYNFNKPEDISLIRDALDRGRKPLLLFPGPDSISLDQEQSTCIDTLLTCGSAETSHLDIDTVDGTGNPSDPGQMEATAPSRLLILLDGTWAQARKMAKESPELLACSQKVQFSAKGNSIYDQIRKEPEDHCLSTLECCAKVLTLLEPSSSNATKAALHLENALTSLVEQQKQLSLNPVDRHFDVSVRLREKIRRRVEMEHELFSRDRSDKQQRLKDGSIMRRLRESDAALVNSQWSRGTASSLDDMHRRISKGIACFGIFQGEDLCGFILQYESGIVGMLQVEEAYRRRGYGTALVSKATETLQANGIPGVAFIMDGNTASEALFSSQGWTRADPTIKRGTGRRRAKRKWILNKKKS
mmetsp:Transcript_16472/g.25708  ORF Transcript_16472/g.25708 Transcript_16472/m.25708 type:complete len:492 (-) Transcript_16472:2168-3643(-)